MVTGAQQRDEQNELERAVAKLEATLTKKNATRTMLSQQVKKLNVSTFCCIRVITHYFFINNIFEKIVEYLQSFA